MRGPEIIARTLSNPRVPSDNPLWQYHSRSDDHSKVACWAVAFDMLMLSPAMQRHVRDGKIAFDVKRELNDWTTGQKKKLDLIVARREADAARGFDLAGLAEKWKIDLSGDDRTLLNGLPTSPGGRTGSDILVAFEAKACMTEHGKARSRLHAELASSYATVHGGNPNAMAIGLVIVNASNTFISPGRSGEVNSHVQPAAAASMMAKMREVKRRPGPASGQPGFDAFGVVMVDMTNDGSPVKVVSSLPAPPPSDDLHYDRMVTRAAHLYETAFHQI